MISSELQFPSFESIMQVFRIYENRAIKNRYGEDVNQLGYGGSYGDFSKALINLDRIIPNAVLVEAHTKDRYADTPRADQRFDGAYVLIGAFRDGDYIIPVKLEIKKELGETGNLYVVVAMTKIKRTSVMESEVPNLNEFDQPLSVTGSMYSLQQIVSKINTKDADFLKYIPDGMLSMKQIAAKTGAKAAEDTKIKKLRDSTYLDAVMRGDMETAQQMVDEAAKKAGATILGIKTGKPLETLAVFVTVCQRTPVFVRRKQGIWRI